MNNPPTSRTVVAAGGAATAFARTTQGRSDDGEMTRFEVYGAVLATDHEFSSRLPEAPDGAPTDLRLEVSADEPAGLAWESADEVHVQGADRGPHADFRFARFHDHDAVRIGEVLDFHVFDDRIVCVLRDPGHHFLVEIALLGMVFSMWLERRGTTTLHASVVTVDGAAVAFLGAKGSGKTSLLAACLRAGHALLVDDLVVLRHTASGPVVARGFPSLRLWPEQVADLLPAGAAVHLIRPDTTKVRADVRREFGPAGFADGPAPLTRVYLPSRRPGPTPVRTSALPVADATMALVRNSFLPVEAHRFGWQPRRLADLARLTAEVPVLQLEYPDGLEHLPGVVNAIEKDLRESDHPVQRAPGSATAPKTA
jgi:hypothetical protein